MTAATASPAVRGQLLHYVLKTTNLRADIDLLTNHGFRVLRHEEFRAQCEAECNGKFARPWSKSMIGRGEERRHFVLEMVFNYGIREYPRGNGLRAVLIDDAVTHQLWDAYKLMPVASSSTSSSTSSSGDMIGVSLHVEELARSIRFYEDVLGMEVVERCRVDHLEAARLSYKHALTDTEQPLPFVLELVELGEPIVHGAAGTGRLAIAVPAAQLDTVAKRLTTGGYRVHTPRISLPTPGKADVEVIISLDPDGHEVCTVGAEAFWELSALTPGCDKIDWAWRQEMGSGEKQ